MVEKAPSDAPRIRVSRGARAPAPARACCGPDGPEAAAHAVLIDIEVYGHDPQNWVRKLVCAVDHRRYANPPGDTRTHPPEWDEAWEGPPDKPVRIGIDLASGPDITAETFIDPDKEAAADALQKRNGMRP